MPLSKSRPPALIAVLLAAALHTSCDDPTSLDNGSSLVSTVILRAPTDSLFYGDSLRLTAVAVGDSATVRAPTFVWSSSDTTIALVDAQGMVRGVSHGAATIRAEFGGRRSEFRVRVVLFRADDGVRFSSMARGVFHPLCALAQDGTPYCEDGTVTPPGGGLPVLAERPSVFAALPGNRGRTFTSFHVSRYSRCGLDLTGVMACWGQNAGGHFGNGMPESFKTDTAVVGAHGRRFKVLSVGGHSHTCGVNADDDVVYCFGHDDLNQVGRGSPLPDDTAVAPTGGAPRGKALTTADIRNCLLTPEGQLLCWGGSVRTPTPVPAPEPFKSVATGHGQTCAFGESGTLYCWGNNQGGEAGVGSAAWSIDTPTPVSGGIRFADVFPMTTSTCAITAAGELYCWGNFAPFWISERLGDARRAPVRLFPRLRFRSLAAGAYVHRTCGVTTDGALYCWQ